MNKMFENKIAVVTGAGGTLCSEIAIQLSLEGARVFLVGRGAEKLEKTADKIKALGGAPAIIFPCDVTDRDAVAELEARHLGKATVHDLHRIEAAKAVRVGIKEAGIQVVAAAVLPIKLAPADVLDAAVLGHEVANASVNADIFQYGVSQSMPPCHNQQISFR